MAEQGITKQQLIAELSRSPHAAGTGQRKKGAPQPHSLRGKLPSFKHRTVGPRKGTGTIDVADKEPKPTPTDRYKEYLPVCAAGSQQLPEFYSRLMSWNLAKGQVKDSRVALPVIALMTPAIVKDRELYENALAHLAALDPRLFVRAMEFAKDQKVLTRTVRRLVERYVRDREADRKRWNGTMLQHRRPMARLYKSKLFRIAPGGGHKDDVVKTYEWNVLEGIYEPDSVFATVAGLKDMPLKLAVQAISKYKLSPLITLPALGAKAKDPDLLVELIRSMTPTELTTSMKLLEKLGVRQNAVTRAALDEALERMKTSKKATLKTSQAAKALDEVDEQIAAKLREVQEKQIDAVSTIEGDWAILADKSGSMEQSIEAARQVSALLARAASKNQVHLAFFDYGPTYYNVSGKTFEEVTELTKRITADGGTSIGSSLNAILTKSLRVDGIVLISDGAENQAPFFVQVYKRYCEFVGKVVPIYFYRVKGQADTFSGQCNSVGIELTIHDIASSADYYSLPMLIANMRVNHYSLTEEVMATPLLKLDEVLSRTTGMEIIKSQPVHA